MYLLSVDPGIAAAEGGAAAGRAGGLGHALISP
jgi:hypothetical protein